METTTARDRYLRRLSALTNERSTWIDTWREIADYIQPRRAKFSGSAPNTGTKQHAKIINGTPLLAARVLSAGMMAGITSPARPWFKLGTPDAELNEYGAVKQWLDEVRDAINHVFSSSNIYNQLYTVYEAIGSWGTCPLHVDEDDEDVIRGYVYPVGQYCLANSARLSVDTTYRELSMTVAQVVERFGLERCSLTLRQRHQRGELDAWVPIVHVIEPNRAYSPGKLGPSGKRWKSCWFERQADATAGLLEESGYEDFPVMAVRWNVSGEDVYGSSPAMDAIGDSKALQITEKREAQAFDKVVNPPMRGPTALMGQKVSLLPGDVTLVDSLGAGSNFGPAMEVNPQALVAAQAKIMRFEERIRSCFYADLWLALASQQGPQMTAREVAERHEEKMLQLGPVMERLNDELLDPLIDRTFNIMLRRGLIPPPPEELQGSDIRVEYISIMAQAQKMLGITGVERLMSFTGSLAAASPDVLDKVDFDQVVDEYSGMVGTPVSIIRTDEDVAKLRQKRAEAQQRQQLAAAAMNAAQGAKTLSEADTGGDNALTRLMGPLGGAPAAGVPGGGSAA